MLLSHVHLLKNLLLEFSAVDSAKVSSAKSPDWQCVTYDLGDYQVVMRKLLFHLSHVSKALVYYAARLVEVRLGFIH